MRARIASVIILLTFCHAAFADDVFDDIGVYFPFPQPATQALLPDAGPESCFRIGHIIFEYPVTLSRKDNLQADDIPKLKSVAETIKAATPGPVLDAIARQQLGQPHVFSFRSVTLLDQGDAGLEWNVDYELFPKVGGFSGVPYRYRAILDGHGRLVTPRVMVYDAYAHAKLDEGWTCSILELPTATSEKSGVVASEEIRKLATTSLGTIKHLASQRMAYQGQDKVRIPIARESNGQLVECEIWSVHFRDPARKTRSNENFTVWVTTDGRAAKVVHLDNPDSH